MSSGHCLCGKTGWQSDRSQNWAGYCHCESCRRNCAAPFTAYIGVPNGHWNWTGETPAQYQSSGGVTRHFCAICGTPMAYAADRWPDEMHFYAAALVDPSDFHPTFHSNHAEHVPWCEVKDDLPRYEGMSS